MKISNSTGKSKDFYNRGKAMFDQIPPVTQAVTQIPQKHSSKRMTVFELIEANGLTLHGDIEHFAELVRADEREACAEVCKKHADVYAGLEQNPATQSAWAACIDNHDFIRARGQA